VYGARPLKRVIQTYLQNPLAEMLLGGEVFDVSKVPISADSEGLVIGQAVNVAEAETVH
jgi:ATP-dependent Clp protease ATP-binding subunit ClpB